MLNLFKKKTTKEELLKMIEKNFTVNELKELILKKEFIKPDDKSGFDYDESRYVWRTAMEKVPRLKDWLNFRKNQLLMSLLSSQNSDIIKGEIVELLFIEKFMEQPISFETNETLLSSSNKETNEFDQVVNELKNLATSQGRNSKK